MRLFQDFGMKSVRFADSQVFWFRWLTFPNGIFDHLHPCRVPPLDQKHGQGICQWKELPCGVGSSKASTRCEVHCLRLSRAWSTCRLAYQKKDLMTLLVSWIKIQMALDSGCVLKQSEQVILVNFFTQWRTCFPEQYAYGDFAKRYNQELGLEQVHLVPSGPLVVWKERKPLDL